MGIVSILSLAVGAATGIAQAVQARKATKARRESQAIQTAGENIRDKMARRRAAKEERIRRARLVQASTTGGTTGSSGEIGATSALGANFASATAQQSASRGISQGISAANARGADAQSRGATIGAFGKIAQQGLGMWDDYQKGNV